MSTVFATIHNHGETLTFETLGDAGKVKREAAPINRLADRRDAIVTLAHTCDTGFYVADCFVDVAALFYVEVVARRCRVVLTFKGGREVRIPFCDDTAALEFASSLHEAAKAIGVKFS